MRKRRSRKEVSEVLKFRKVVVLRRAGQGPCWEWCGYRNEDGYGKIAFEGKTPSVHRVAWMLWVGPIPKGIEVAHTCDNPPCFNPKHLYLATHAENIADAVRRNRYPSKTGQLHPNAKLNEQQVREIRRRYVKGSQSRFLLAKEFGICDGAVYAIASRRSWTHI